MTSLIRFLLTLQFYYKLLLRENFRNPFKDISVEPEKRMLILANGPSLKDFLARVGEDPASWSECEFFALNTVACDPLFSVIRPRHYVLSDVMFFRDTVFSAKGQSAIEALAEKVDWDMYLYIPFRYRNEPYMSRLRENGHIRIVLFHSVRYNGLEGRRNRIFRRGLGNGEYGTVILNAIYIALTLGCTNVELYGVDHTFFTGLAVNDDNVPCYEYRHFNTDVKESKPMIWHHDSSRQYFDMELFLEEKHNIFLGHKIMADYAAFLGAKVYNCTPGSLIDSYPRKKTY